MVQIWEFKKLMQKWKAGYRGKERKNKNKEMKGRRGEKGGENAVLRKRCVCVEPVPSHATRRWMVDNAGCLALRDEDVCHHRRLSWQLKSKGIKGGKTVIARTRTHKEEERKKKRESGGDIVRWWSEKLGSWLKCSNWLGS